MAKDETYVAVFSGENRANLPVYPLDVFVLTERGTAETRGGATRLPADALAVLVALDGMATVGDLEQTLRHIPAEALRNLIRSLIAGGLIRAPTIAESEGLDFSEFFQGDPSGVAPSEGAVASADREAENGAPALERTGYYVSFARQAVAAAVPPAGGKRSALIVEDDIDMANLVQRLLEGEGFEVVASSTREQILDRIRRTPAPDVVILDVHLPDINGFDILKRLKAHPTLKSIPVIMLTAEATREGVMRGVLGGADGYITKPFERRVLIGGVKAVLGLDA